MEKNLQNTIIALLPITIIAVVVGRRFLSLANLSMKHLDFKYQEANKVKRWIEWMTPLAKDVGAKYGIPYQAIVVQTAIETGWGKSSLFLKHNNYGGMKPSGSEPYVELMTTEYIGGQRKELKQKFRVWASKYDGLMGYANFFHKYSRYKTALQFPNDPYRFIEEIKKAGYATDPLYVSKLHGMLKTHFPTT